MCNNALKNQSSEKDQTEDSPKIKELMQQKIILKEINKYLEEKLRHSEANGSEQETEIHKINELEQQKAILTELNSQLSKNDTDVGNVLTTLSHEFKTPMVPIQAYTDLLLEGHLGELTEEQRERLKIMKNSISLLHELVSDSIESKKLELGQIVMSKTKTNITKLISDELKKFNKDERNHIVFNFSPKEDIIVLCDSDMILHVLTNLIKNSIKAVPKENGMVSINIEHNDNEIIITVKDNGRGIPEDKLSKLFSKFGKIDSTETRDDAGVGLGLYLCKQIIDAHGGRIWIESKEKMETKVYFTLPRVTC